LGKEGGKRWGKRRSTPAKEAGVSKSAKKKIKQALKKHGSTKGGKGGDFGKKNGNTFRPHSRREVLGVRTVGQGAGMYQKEGLLYRRWGRRGGWVGPSSTYCKDPHQLGGGGQERGAIRKKKGKGQIVTIMRGSDWVFFALQGLSTGKKERRVSKKIKTSVI